MLATLAALAGLQAPSLDLTRLNVVPAGRTGQVIVRNSRLVERGSGQRVRFLGVNLDLDRVDMAGLAAEAKALARLGVNGARLTLRPATDLGRLDQAVADLKAAGIYSLVHIRLAEEQDPQLPFDRDQVLRQQRILRDILHRVNPRTRIRYELETALLGVEWSPAPESADRLMDPSRAAPTLSMLARWNEWLKLKHKDEAGLAAAWSTQDEPLGPETLPPLSDSAAWPVQLEGGAQAFAGFSSEGWRLQVLSQKGQGSIRLEAKSQPFAVGLQTVRFVARASSGSVIQLGIGPFERLVGLDQEWREYEFVLRPQTTEAASAPLRMQLQAAPGVVWIRELSRRAGGRLFRPDLGESLEKGSVLPPLHGLGAPQADWRQFLLETEAGYWREMRRWMEQDLRLGCLIGGPSLLPRAGVHVFRAASQLDFAGAEGGLALSLSDLAGSRLAGKPFFVRSLEPSPVGADTSLAAVAAASQEWDAVFLSGELSPASRALLPAAAIAFRRGRMAPLPALEAVVLRPDDSLPERPSLEQAMLRARLAVSLTPVVSGLTAPGPQFRLRTDGVLAAGSPEAAAFIGKLGGLPMSFPGAFLGFEGQAGKAGAGWIISLTGRPLATSERVLVAVSDFPATAKLRVDGPRQVWSLNDAGEGAEELPATLESGVLSFKTKPGRRLHLVVRPQG